MKAQLVICVVLIIAILTGGCEGLSNTKYRAGDIVSFEEGYQEAAYVILDYDKTSDQYLVTMINRDELGRWRDASIKLKNWTDRDIVEMIYPCKLGHVDVEDLKMTIW